MLLYLCIFFSFLGISTAQTTNYDCGRATPQASPLVIGGLRAHHGELPWHVGVYRKTTSPYKQICGGSIVSRTLVVSAAHCFWDVGSQVQHAADFAVAAGKLFRPWDVDKDRYAQRTDVKEILVPELFRGEDRNYAEDIALVVVVTPFRFRPYLRPVCLDFDPDFEEKQLVAGSLGKVAGWGLTAANGSASAVLQVVELPYVTQTSCLKQSPKNYWEYITNDKICAGVGNGQSTLCQGDSGGGLVFPHTLPGVERYYLRGIVSTSPSSAALCNSYAITSFTKVSNFRRFIEQRFNPVTDSEVQLGNEVTSNSSESACVLPPPLEHGNYTSSGLLSVVLNYVCDPGWILEGDPVGICENGAWRRPIPKCVPANSYQGCLLDVQDQRVEYKCGERACQEREPSGTQAQAVCRAPDFTFPDAAEPQQTKRMVCLKNSWDRVPYCQMDCGRVTDVTPQSTPEQSDARPVQHGEFPWHVGVYELVGGNYHYRCGGSVLSSSMVLTAAHCFWNEAKGELGQMHRFAVSAAKISKEWYAPEDYSGAQRSEIDRVAIPDNFRGAAEYYKDDLALVFLARPFKLKPFLRPVCLDFTEPSPGEKGFLAGLGKYGNTETTQVYSVQLPLVSVSDCIGSMKPAELPFVTSDKFCAGSANDSALCKAGAGGGLTFLLRDGSGAEQYRVRGVAVGLAGTTSRTGADCGPALPTFTSLAKHEQFIRQHFNP